MTNDAEPTAGDSLPPLSAVFGGGGVFGIGYALGICNALADAGVDFTATDMLGTSAGSWVASCLATGVTFSDLCEVPQVRVPDPRPGMLRGIAGEVFGEQTSDRVKGSSLRLPSMRRVLLSGAEHPLADIVAASSAVPGLFRPARIGTASYVDGGVRSVVSADLAAPAQQLLIVAPLAGPMFGPGGRGLERLLRREIARWERRTGGTAHVFRPDAEIAGLARLPLHLFDNARAKAAYPLAYTQARNLLLSRPGLGALLATGSAAA
jgi:predicted acylesterase/phospholipase RssA